MKVSFEPICQWPEWFKWRRMNWLNFDPIRLSFEWDRVLRVVSIETCFVLLGVGFYLTLKRESAHD